MRKYKYPNISQS